LILLLLSAELIWWGNRFIFTEHADLYRKPSALAIDTNPLYRIFTGKGIPADRSMLYHHFNLNGYEAIFLQRFTSYLGLRQKHVLNATGVEKPNFDDPILRALSVKYDVEPSSNCAIAFSELSSPRPRIFVPLTIKNFDRSEQIDMTNYMRSTKTGPDEEIILSNLPAGFPIASGAWQINSFTAGSIKLSAELTLKKSSAVVISDIAYTGWRAWAAGIEYPVLPANRALLCVLLPGGSYINSNKLVLYFLPPSHQLGALLTVISLLTAIAVVFILLKRKPNIVL
jgi:hypothetical protein